jgi:RNA-directed DNA polymerase
VGQNQFLKLDVHKFYPSTSGEHIFRWAYHAAGLQSNVAGLLKHLVATDDRMPFGSPVSPILISLVHRPMFDQVFAASARCGVLMSLWVDNLVLSGPSVPGVLLREICDIIRRSGFQTHDIRFQEASRPVTITSVPIDDGRVVAPHSVYQRFKDGYVALRSASMASDRLVATDVLLSSLGTYRYLVGSTTLEGRKTANRMNVLRRRRAQLTPIFITRPSTPWAVTSLMVLALIGLRGVDLDHRTSVAMRAPSRALPRRRALCTNWKQPR